MNSNCYHINVRIYTRRLQKTIAALFKIKTASQLNEKWILP